MSSFSPDIRKHYVDKDFSGDNVSSYNDLSDEDKLTMAINFIARGQPLPTPLVEFLVEAGLYELIVNPNAIEIRDGDS